MPQLVWNDYKVCPKQLEHSSEICDQTGCYLNTKQIGIESCVAWVWMSVANYLLK